MGYQGPRTTPDVLQGQHHDPPEQREFDFTPYLLNGKEDTHAVVANRVQSLHFDVVVVGHHCHGPGGVVVCTTVLVLCQIQMGSVVQQRCVVGRQEQGTA